jgi:hypothetical protein
MVVGWFEKKHARFVPENTGRSGRYKSTMQRRVLPL